MDYIFFDFNGTIIDDVDLCLELLNTMLVSCNHKPVSKKEYLDIFCFPIIDYYQKAGFLFPKDDFDKLAKWFIEVYKKRNIECPLYDDVKETLQLLKNKGKHLFILSASEKTMLLQQLEHYGIASFFDDVLGKDDIYASGKSEIGKAYIEEKSFDKDKCVFIGDTLHDEETADAMGIKCCLVLRGHQSAEQLAKGHSTIYQNLKDIIY